MSAFLNLLVDIDDFLTDEVYAEERRDIFTNHDEALFAGLIIEPFIETMDPRPSTEKKFQLADLALNFLTNVCQVTLETSARVAHTEFNNQFFVSIIQSLREVDEPWLSYVTKNDFLTCIKAAVSKEVGVPPGESVAKFICTMYLLAREAQNVDAVAMNGLTLFDVADFYLEKNFS